MRLRAHRHLRKKKKDVDSGHAGSIEDMAHRLVVNREEEVSHTLRDSCSTPPKLQEGRGHKEI